MKPYWNVSQSSSLSSCPLNCPLQSISRWRWGKGEGLWHGNWFFIEPYNCEIFHCNQSTATPSSSCSSSSFSPQLSCLSSQQLPIGLFTWTHTHSLWNHRRDGRRVICVCCHWCWSWLAAPPFSEPTRTRPRYYTGNELNIAQEPLVGALPINFNGHQIGYGI